LLTSTTKIKFTIPDSVAESGKIQKSTRPNCFYFIGIAIFYEASTQTDTYLTYIYNYTHHSAD